jgi:hypothetical protein
MKLAPVMQLRGVRPETVLVAVVIDSVYARHGLDAAITSVVRAPSATSLHDDGLALDVRLPSASERIVRPLVEGDDLDELVLDDLRRALGPHCDVVDERKPLHDPPPVGWGPHFHVEIQPRAPARR